jgi:dsDNA-specific endonuclease/ATPase MutS2
VKPYTYDRIVDERKEHYETLRNGTKAREYVHYYYNVRTNSCYSQLHTCIDYGNKTQREAIESELKNLEDELRDCKKYIKQAKAALNSPLVERKV